MRSRTSKTETFALGHNIANSRGLPLEYLYAALDSLKLGVAVIDRRLRFATVNRALATMNNIPQEAHPGKKLHEVLGAFFTKVEPLIEHVFSTGLPATSTQLSGRLPKRRDIGYWTTYYFPIKDDRRRVKQVGGFVMEFKSNPPFQSSLDPILSPANRKSSGDKAQTHHSNEIHRTEVAKPHQAERVLSPREMEVLRFLASGKPNKEISSILGISLKTVETHRSRVMLKIQAPSLVHLVHYALRHEIVEPL